MAGCSRSFCLQTLLHHPVRFPLIVVMEFFQHDLAVLSLQRLLEQKIAEVVRSNGSLKAKAHKLVDLANEAGGLDNIAVVLISR